MQELMNAAISAHKSNDLERAKKIYEDILSKDPNAIGAAINLSVILLKQNVSPLNLLRPFANEKAPPELWFNLGLAYAKEKMQSDAEIAFQNTLVLSPKFHQAKYELARLANDNDALILLSEAIKLEPGKDDYWVAFAELLIKLNQKQEAVQALMSAFNAGVKSVKILITLGLIYWHENLLDEAKIAFEGALLLNPDNPEALWQLSLINLKQKNFAQGWGGLWVRFNPNKQEHIALPSINVPIWDGKSVASLLIIGEQGFGDNIQFARFLPYAATIAKKLYFAPRPELVRLFKESPIISECCEIVDINNLPKFDAWFPVMELAAVYGATQNNIPFKDGYLLNKKKKTNADFRVGIVWQGNPKIARLDNLRSIALKDLALVFDMAGIEFISLQQGHGKEQLSECGFNIKDGGTFNDFAQTAQLIETLDLVISVDSSVAHLSGAMGKPTIILLPFVSCWRWGLDDNVSYWYDSVKLIRQTAPQNWSSVAEELKKELAKLSQR